MRNVNLFPSTDPVTVKPAADIEPLLVDLQTAARLFGCSDRHLRKYLHALPHVRIGNRLLFRVDALREWLLTQEQTAK